jgi:hypothetical protein
MPWRPPWFRLRQADAFFTSLTSALQDSSDWRLHGSGVLDDARYVSGDYVGSKFAGEGLHFAVCCYRDQPSDGILTMHARRWSDDRCFPSDAEYQTAEDLTSPVFSKAGNIMGGRLILCRWREKPHLRGKLAECFYGFCFSARDLWAGGIRDPLGQQEYERFYSFTCAAHRWRSSLEGYELRRALLQAGFKPEQASELVEHYSIGRRMLCMLREGRRRSHGIDPWNPWTARDDRRRWLAMQKRKHAEEYRAASGKNPE